MSWLYELYFILLFEGQFSVMKLLFPMNGYSRHSLV